MITNPCGIKSIVCPWNSHNNEGFKWHTEGFPGGSVGKESARNVGDLGLIPGLGRSPGERNDNPLQYSCLENSMDGEAWWATVHGVAKSWTWLSNFTHSLSSLRGNYLPVTFPHYMGSRNCFSKIKILSSTSLVLNICLVKVIYRDWVIWFPVQYSYCDSTPLPITSLGTKWKMGTKQR